MGLTTPCVHLLNQILNETYPFWSRWALKPREEMQTVRAKPSTNRGRRRRETIPSSTATKVPGMPQTIFCRSWRIEGVAGMQTSCGNSTSNKDRNGEASFQRPALLQESCTLCAHRDLQGGGGGSSMSDIALGVLAFGFLQLNREPEKH